MPARCARGSQKPSEARLVLAGDPMSALGAAMAQQQFHAVLDGMSYEEMYEYFGGGLLPPASAATSTSLAVKNTRSLRALENGMHCRDLFGSALQK